MRNSFVQILTQSGSSSVDVDNEMSVSKDTFAEAAELARYGVAELNAEGYFVAMDEGYLSIFGSEVTSLIGRHWSASVHPDDHDGVDAAYRLARKNGRGYAEIRAMRNGSTVVNQALMVTSIYDHSQTLLGYQCLHRYFLL